MRARSEQKDDPDEVRIQEEIKEYGDIWRLDMVDTYADLSLKTLKMFTVLPQKIDADFYFKIDDDVAVNVDAMATYLTQRRNQGNLYLVRSPGNGARGQHPSPNPQGFGHASVPCNAAARACVPASLGDPNSARHLPGARLRVSILFDGRLMSTSGRTCC